MKRKRDSRPVHTELLPENWSLVRVYWALLILWERWRAMLSDASRQYKYIDRPLHVVREQLDRSGGVFIRELTGLQWYGNRVAVLVGASALIYVSGKALAFERIKVLFMFVDEDACYRKWRSDRWREAIADDIQVTLVDITSRVIT